MSKGVLALIVLDQVGNDVVDGDKSGIQPGVSPEQTGHLLGGEVLEAVAIKAGGYGVGGEETAEVEPKGCDRFVGKIDPGRVAGEQ